MRSTTLFFADCNRMKDQNKFKILDFHTNKLINHAPSLNCAILKIYHDIMSNPNRVYMVKESEDKVYKEVWSGDSWDISQYLRENLPNLQTLRDEIDETNLGRMFGVDTSRFKK